MPLSQASLAIAFDVTRTKAVLRVLPQHMNDLTQLAAHFPHSTRRGPLVVEMELDGFLAGIDALATWPAHESVQWEDELVQLVQGVLDDAEIAERHLLNNGSSPAADEVQPGEILSLLGSGWVADLTPFQMRDVARLLTLRHGANFSVPGAGKTRVALAVFSAMRKQNLARRALVVSPKSAYESWHFESAFCFDEPLRSHVMDKAPEPGAELLIVNYERLGRSLGSLASWLRAAPSMMILDEAHRMKLGAKGTYGSACLSLGPLAPRRLILTGTPAPNGARDLESLLSFVWPGHGRRVVNDAVRGGDLAYASAALRPLFVRTTKSELGLPPYEPKIRYVSLPPLHREIYDALRSRYSARAIASRDQLDTLGRTVLRLLMAAITPALLIEGTSRYEPLAYQVPPLQVSEQDSLYNLLQNLTSYEVAPKYQETLAIVEKNASLGRKTLVWSTFVRSLTSLQALLSPYKPALVHGGVPDREEEIRRFREDPDCMVLLSNPATLGEGISLHQVCHDAVYVDRDFMAGRFLQSLDRIHRLGLPSDAETRVTILATRETIDETVAERLEAKLQFMGQILDDPDVQQLADLDEEPSVASGMDMNDVQALLSHLTTPPRQLKEGLSMP
ncbi:DEAD/DEAH box helicase [Sinosporangium siamense]|uniref:DNA helicase n=1 Tax=Sinosporangium siamense TaxID=1367973 RepID=A0A919VE82_9ACTN|nr:DEAD/DEAH box helicase [Sinosporangium siamense]GII94864.1 DNA helicase [Sinosporangium siamense]